MNPAYRRGRDRRETSEGAPSHPAYDIATVPAGRKRPTAVGGSIPTAARVVSGSGGRGVVEHACGPNGPLKPLAGNTLAMRSLFGRTARVNPADGPSCALIGGVGVAA